MKTLGSLLSLALLAAASRAHAGSDGDDDDTSDTPLPLVVWHGLGDSYDRLGPIGDLANRVHEGTFTYFVKIGDSPASDRQASFVGNVSAQVDAVCEQMAADPILSTAPAIDAMGYSQGGMFLRAYVERCNNPPVRSLVTFGSPHNGVVRLMECGGNYLCRALTGLFQNSAWSETVQSRFVPAQYYRPVSEYEQYLEHSALLADINNEREGKNGAYARNIAALENFVMVMFEDDTKLVPKESAWFEEVDDEGVSTPLRARKLYTKDWIGLRELDRKGGLKFKKTPGEHLDMSDEYLGGIMKEFFGSARRGRGSRVAGEYSAGEL